VKRLCSWHGWLILLVLAGCSSTPPRPRAAPSTTVPTTPTTVLPSNAPNPDEIADAVPRLERRSLSGNPPFYVVAGHRYAVLPSSIGFIERGVASWYGTEFHGLKTSTGEPYDMFAMTAAHKTLPLPCFARVTNLSNGRSVVVRINDRGPFVDNRVIDLSYSAARKLDMIRNGTAFVQVEVLTPAAPVITAELPVTAPAVAAASVGVSSVPPVAAPASTFFIQVGAYARPENAESIAHKLRAEGIDHVITLAPGGSQTLERVRIGPIASVQQFDALIARLLALGYPNARLAQD
jgi:rare lipoprotein A